MKPFEIIAVHPRLFLSNKVWIDRDLPLLCERGIGAIVNLVEDHDYPVPASIAYLRAPFVDGTYIDPAMLHEIYGFLARHLRRTRVLIHCAAGVSRSAGVVLGQLLIENPDWTWEKALRNLNGKRSVWVATEVKESVLGYLAGRADRQQPRSAKAGDIAGGDRDVLRRLERLTGIALPELPVINWNSRGYQARHNRIVGLGLFDAGLTDFPSPITRLSGVVEIKMYRNRLRALPHDINRLPRLKVLGLFANEIDSLPEAIGRLPALRVLNLAGNRLTCLPPAIGRLAALRELYLQSNCLEAIPASLADLAQLRHLYLQKNRLTQLPEALANLAKLVSFSAEANMLTSVPKPFCRFPAIRSLNLSDNQIKALPAGPWQMSKLENLNVSRNLIECLPSGLSALESMRRLNIAWNRLTCVPVQIRQWLVGLRDRGCTIVAGDHCEETQDDEFGV